MEWCLLLLQNAPKLLVIAQTQSIFLELTVTPLSQASSIGWDDGEVVHMTRTEVVRSEGVVGLSDIGTVSTEDVCWPVLICHILDDDRVPETREQSSRH